jgi:hypothetical protein
MPSGGEMIGARRAARLSFSAVALFLLSGMASGGSAQETTVGIRGGLSLGFTFFENEVNTQRETRPSPIVGGLATFPLRSWMAFQAEALYVEKGWLDPGGAGGLRMGYVEVPVLLRLQSSGRLLPHVLLGPSLAYQVVCSFSDIPGMGDVGCDDPLVSLDRSKVDIGFVGGVGIGRRVRNGTLSLDVILDAGVHDVIREPMPWGAQTNLALFLSLAYAVSVGGDSGADR